LIFGWGPNHTAIGTFGILLMIKGRIIWILFIPALLCIIPGSLLSYGFGTIEIYWLAPISLVAIIAAVFKRVELVK